MKVEIITLFPDFFISPLKVGRLNKALEQKNLKIKIHNLFDYGKGSYKQVDDRPYGGGPGMVLMIEPIWKVLKKIKAETGRKEEKIVLLSASGQLFNQKKAEEYSKLKRLILICGHFEGVDERVTQYLVDEEISIGNYVLSGGEPAALVVLDATVRLIEGVVGREESLVEESFQITNNEKQTLVEYPQYTRPENFKGMKVPKVLLSGNHQEIKKWRLKQALFKTKKNRPDLIK